MDTQKNQIIERLKTATNILVTVSNNPTVDQLAGAIGLTLVLNKLGKHASAVFSGGTPNTIEFLQPEKTLEKNTDSLRDFIIALDKSKADKLRYKVDGNMVKIFITPYRASISDKDLEYSQGDFNVEVVLALGVKEQQDLDQAITSHGRILHDATVVSVSARNPSTLGSINWASDTASSLCEMLADLSLALQADVLDAQMATALLTGIVAETDRFRNEKTSSQTMELSGKLMSAGANQQLVATQLETPPEPEPEPEPEEKPDDEDSDGGAGKPQEKPPKKPDDGSLEIDHNNDGPDTGNEGSEELEVEPEPPIDQIQIDEHGELNPIAEPLPVPEPAAGEPEDDEDVELPTPEEPPEVHSESRMMLQPPERGGKLTANDEPETLDPSTDALSQEEPAAGGDKPPQIPLLGQQHEAGEPAEAAPEEPAAAPEAEELVDDAPETLADIEKSVESPHAATALAEPEELPAAAPAAMVDDPDLDAARDAVTYAANNTPSAYQPPAAVQPTDLNLGDIPAVTAANASDFSLPSTVSSEPVVESDPGLPPSLHIDDPGPPVDNTATAVANPTAPPPVPPPMMPPT